MRKVTILCAFLVACGGGDDAASSGADGGTGADGSLPSGTTAFVVSTDFASAGMLSTLDVATNTVSKDLAPGAVSTDPVIRAVEDEIIVVNRFGADNISVLSTGGTVLKQVSTGQGSNPQDVARVGNELFVAALASPGLLVLSRDNLDAGVVRTIDLSALDPDGKPNCQSVVKFGDNLLTTCGLLDDSDQFLTPRGVGLAVLVNPTSGAIVSQTELTTANPVGHMFVSELGGKNTAMIATVPDYADLNQGCLVSLTLDDNQSLNAQCLENAALGGFVGGVVSDDEDIWFAVVTGFGEDFAPLGELSSQRLFANGIPAKINLPEGSRVFDLALCPTGELLLADAAGGIRVLGKNGAMSELLDVGLPPVSDGIVCIAGAK